MIREVRLWIISIILGWLIDLTPKEVTCGPLLISWLNAAKSLGEIK